MLQTEPDGLCLARSVLLQIRHDLKHFNELHLIKMVAHHLLRFSDVLYPYIKADLGDQSYVSYCKNIYHGRIWGDDIMYATIAHMWNVSISVIMPHSDPLHLFHDEHGNPDIVVVANGSPVESPFWLPTFVQQKAI